MELISTHSLNHRLNSSLGKKAAQLIDIMRENDAQARSVVSITAMAARTSSTVAHAVVSYLQSALADHALIRREVKPDSAWNEHLQLIRTELSTLHPITHAGVVGHYLDAAAQIDTWAERFIRHTDEDRAADEAFRDKTGHSLFDLFDRSYLVTLKTGYLWLGNHTFNEPECLPEVPLREQKRWITRAEAVSQLARSRYRTLISDGQAEEVEQARIFGRAACLAVERMTALDPGPMPIRQVA